ncbi:MAG: glycosyltransferase [Sphingobacteriales bacterium]|nr:glycosyltransferase [Sphingobacteriales bacterium]OJY84321.1 MAG: glycosyl transferase family 1 [Sphingobacteriales bacterium 44-15]
MASIVILGPAHPLRGGLATFDQRLCRQFMREGHSCSIYSFSLQYPSFLFPGTTQYSSDPAPEDITIHSVINSVNPLNWIKTGNRLRKEEPDFIVVRYWLPFMAPALGTILRRVKKNKHTRIVAITDNVIPHEKRPGDKQFTGYFLKSCDAFVTMSEKVMSDLRKFDQQKPAVQVLHPLYDNFGPPITMDEARKKLNLSPREKIIVFFGFIRKYKGLDLLLEALPHVRTPVKLLIAGEFYEEEKPYLDQIQRLGINENVLLHTHFIPDSEVRYYICAADVVIQPYRSATQSGVTPLCYHFETPMIVTNAGSLPVLVPDMEAGLVCEPVPSSIAESIDKYFSIGKEHFIPYLQEEKKNYSWEKLTKTLLDIGENVGFRS